MRGAVGSEDGERMRVLVTETTVDAAGPAIEALVAAGHEVVRCHEPGAPAFPCAGLTGRSAACPVADTAIDVALTVRSHPRSQPAPLEDGAICALRRHVPLVVTGSTALHPFGEFATEVVPKADARSLVDACERAALAPLPHHTAVATQAWEATLANHDLDPSGSSIVVTRVHGGLLVAIEPGPEMTRPMIDMASVRVLAALRAIDTESRAIDVRVLARH
ncbi:MAG: hypothetical protein U0V73_06715 [Acidimicrobiia bacterium]